MTSRKWCFTLFVIEGEVIEREGVWEIGSGGTLKALIDAMSETEYDGIVGYVEAQLEECPDSGRLHWQGVLHLKSPVRMSALKKLLGNSVHLETMKGPWKKALDYVRKDQSSLGISLKAGVEPKGQGARSDLEGVCQRIVSGESLKDIAHESPATFVRNYRGLSVLASLSQKGREKMTECHIIWGVSGAGKTHSVWAKEPDLYVKGEGKWWDGYCGQKAVLFDDVDWDMMELYMSHTNWLKLLDKYPMDVEVKGGTTKFLAERVYITSMYDPSRFLLRDGVKRRVTTVVHMDGSYVT